MSRIVSPVQVVQAVQNQRGVLDEQAQRLQEADRYHQAQRGKVESERDQAAFDLAQAVLPALDAPSLAKAATITGLGGLPSEDLPGKREARRAFLTSRLQQILGDPRYRDRELLRHPRTGSHTLAIADAEEQRRPLADVVALCETHPRFERLMEIGFGTPEQKTPWWRFSYWGDRSGAAEIAARFPGKTFGQVREDYRVAKETVATFDGVLARLRHEVASGEALDREYASLYEEHLHLDERALEHTRGRIIRHMLGSDPSLMGQRLSKWGDIRLLFLRASGLAAKTEYLDGIHRKNFGELRADLDTQRTKLDGIYNRAAYRGQGLPIEKYEWLAQDRRPKYEKRWQRWGKSYQTVYVYDRWNRGRYYEDLLWWDIMTRGRMDGSYIDSVSLFHRSHPDYEFDASANTVFHTDTDDFGSDDSAAAAADADSQSRDGDDGLTGRDAS